MAYISNQTNARSMNRIIILTDGFCKIDNRKITTEGDIKTLNILITNIMP